MESHDAVDSMEATTGEGLVAKARAALVENDAEFQACETGGAWAYHVLRDLLPIHGRVE